MNKILLAFVVILIICIVAMLYISGGGAEKAKSRILVIQNIRSV